MQIFISHASDGKYFVTLLAKLLEAHGHVPCLESDGNDCESADTMIAVLTRNTVRSKAVREHVGAFRTQKKQAKIIPILLSGCDNPDEVAPGLKNSRPIDFTQCMHTGFNKLFQLLGNDFLSASEFANRRSGAERRERADRRTSSVDQRISIGLVVRYCREKKAHLLDENFAAADLNQFTSTVAKELERYNFREGIQEVERAYVLESVMMAVRTKLTGQQQKSVTQILQAIAAEIRESFHVEVVDRRHASDRRAS